MAVPRVLLVDDDEAFLDLFAVLLAAQNLKVRPFTSPSKVLEIVAREPIDLVVTDVQMPEMSGIELFHRIQDISPDTPVILITAFGSTEDAVSAVKQGAFHYFEKPIHEKLDLVWTAVREALAKRKMLLELSAIRKAESLQMPLPVEMIGQSAAIGDVMRSIQEVADLPATVLIEGETGTGKELVARAIHGRSERSEKPLFTVNCTEFAPGVLESELFGHEKGAFTGAASRKKGIFELSHQGTLFLDEIGEASQSLQVKLLRVLETKTFMRVGGSAPIQSDFRLVAATNRSLAEETTAGRFRQDLFYRLNVYTIKLPPLRDRREDIPLLAEFYLNRFSRSYRRPVSGISTDAMLALREYDWPGNVRELVNVIERAVITCREDRVTTRHLPFSTVELPQVSSLNLKDVEKFFIQMALKQTRNNKSRASELLGISRRTLIEKVKTYGLDDLGSDD